MKCFRLKIKANSEHRTRRKCSRSHCRKGMDLLKKRLEKNCLRSILNNAHSNRIPMNRKIQKDIFQRFGRGNVVYGRDFEKRNSRNLSLNDC